MTFKISATIPTGQYANITPELEVEAETFEEAQRIGLEQIQKIWNTVCEDGRELKIKEQGPTGNFSRIMKCKFSGTELAFDEGQHVYMDNQGTVYLSGSQYASKFTYPFDKSKILPAYAAKVQEEASTIEGFWQTKNDLSMSFGTALHAALEVYGKYKSLAEKLEKPLGIPPILMGPVEEFFDEREVDEEAWYEVFVADKNNKWCGQIDRLVKTGPQSVIIEDYKTNADLDKVGSPTKLKTPFTNLPNNKLSEYTLQLNFYRTILENIGITVDGMRIQHYGPDGWKTIPIDKVELT